MDYVRGVRKMLEDHGVKGVIFGHAGDAHMHVNPLVDVSASDWRETVNGVLEDTTELVQKLGGTLSGEHGDGRIRTPLMDRTWHHESRALFKIVKDAFDPAGILNPGVKVPAAGQKPVGDVKYDPALAAAAGRRAERCSIPSSASELGTDRGFRRLGDAKLISTSAAGCWLSAVAYHYNMQRHEIFR